MDAYRELNIEFR